MADQKQTHPPKHRYNPAQGGAPNGGGAPEGDITNALSLAQQRAVGNSVKRCYTEDTEARNYATFGAHLRVTVDATGTARLADIVSPSADPALRAFQERAREAVLDPACASLPLPGRFTGQTHTLDFVFRP